MQTKICAKCDAPKQPAEFSKMAVARDGLQQQCKACERARLRARTPKLSMPAEKTCVLCRGHLPSSQFHRSVRHADGLDHRCKSCRKLEAAAYYENNRALCLKRNKQWKKNNPEKWAIVRARNYAKSPQPYIKDAVLERTRRRRARKKGCVGSYTQAEWLALKEHYGSKCLRCGKSEGTTWGDRVTADHVIPLAFGGPDTIDNIQPLCMRCNKWKHVKAIDFRVAQP